MIRLALLGAFVLAAWAWPASEAASVPEPGSCPKVLVAGAPSESEGHSYPAWSPDGRWIAFTSHQDGNYDIYLIRPDGSALVRLTDDPAIDAHPSWSPDSRWLSFDSTRDGNRDGFLVSAGGCDAQNVTGHPATDGPLNWSPDGAQVAFSSDRSGEDQIYRATLHRPQGESWSLSDPAALTRGAGRNQAPSFHPAGDLILFESRREGNREQYVMRADGSAVRNVTRDPAADFSGRWSPGGDRIAFWSNRSDNEDLYLVLPDGGALRRLTEHPARDRMPAWSPDGARLVFASDRSGRWELFIMSLADGQVRQLTCGLRGCREGE